MRKLLLVAIGITLLLSSCSNTFYQVYKTEAPGLSESDNALVFENDDCKVVYNLWAQNGNSGFVMHNKTDEDLYVILPQTFFIKNGVAFDYFQNREYQSSQSIAASASIYGIANFDGTWYDASKGAAKGTSYTVIQKENPIICIPPHTSKYIFEYNILDGLIRSCDKHQMHPKRMSAPMEFTKEDSPLNFKNRITYAFNKCGKGSKCIENEFWISELINYSKKEAGSTKTITNCDGDIGAKKYIFRISAPYKFYNSYKKTSEAGKYKADNKAGVADFY